MKKWINKYTITLFIFAIILGFVGDQSIRVRWKKHRQIKALEVQRDAYCTGIEDAKHTIEYLQITDSLERYARERYLMHSDNEDVFLVDEDD